MSSFQGKLRFYEIFIRQKSLFVQLAKEKSACRSGYEVPRRKFYSFYVRAAIDRDTMEWTTKFPRAKPCTRLLLYLSLVGFVCGFSVIHRWTMLEKMRKTLSVAILVAIKVKLFQKQAR